MKLRMRYEKADPVKYISHLDMVKAFERAFRRAKLPLAFSEGFTPHPRLTFAPALSVGITSSGEYMDADFYENVPASEAMCRLNSSLPEGLRILKIGIFDGKYPLSKINAASYSVTIAGFLQEDVARAAKELLNQKQVIIEKVLKDKVKRVDVAPFIHCIDVKSGEGGNVFLGMELAVGQGGSVSPDMVLKQLERYLPKEITVKYIHREDLYLKQDGLIIPPL
ncbi:MAG TPA: DUF2344 domain-containing protein [Thermoanaerobacterales bacterium]|nr:DUF2344 domain-containing protein [Thermoanaerobacterales bacterium]